MTEAKLKCDKCGSEHTEFVKIKHAGYYREIIHQWDCPIMQQLKKRRVI